MGRTPQETMAIERRRQHAAELYVQGWSQAGIARELDVAQSTVSADLKAIRREWRESRVRDFDDAIVLELAKLDQLEREAWSGWMRSQEPAETTRVVDGRAGKRAEKVTRHQVGDPRFLGQIQRCIAGRRALLGLDAPTRIATTSPDGDESYSGHVMGTPAERMEKVLQRLSAELARRGISVNGEAVNAVRTVVDDE